MHMTVERLSYLHKDDIDDLMDTIKHTLRSDMDDDVSTVRQAMAMVRNDDVANYRLDSDDGTVVATVGTAAVLFSFNEKFMNCSCDIDGWCSHRVAIVFHLFSQFHSLTDWMHEWRQTETQQMMLSISERTPDAWINTLTSLTSPLRRIRMDENPGVFIHESSMMDQRAIPLTPFEWEWKPLFELYYRLHVLDAGWSYVSRQLGSHSPTFFYGKWYVENWLTDQLGKLQDSVNAVGAKPKLFEADSFHDRIKELVRNFALNNDGLFEERFKVYLLFWENVFPMNAARLDELEILQNEHSPEAKIFVAFFNLLQGNYEALELLLTDLTSNELKNWLPLAHFAEHNEDTRALSIIMHALLPYIGDHITTDVPLSSRSIFVRDLDGLLEAADFTESERESMFPQYGEAGIDVYADFLIERQRFAEWASLMHRYSITFEEAEASGLKHALSIDPAAVLPLLHVYAMNFIKEKNRHSYRRAVKIFKKMKAGSKKSGKYDFWNRYINTVREKNRRLRALIEEMEKGNLNL